jgi:hypothetical protein
MLAIDDCPRAVDARQLAVDLDQRDALQMGGCWTRCNHAD